MLNIRKVRHSKVSPARLSTNSKAILKFRVFFAMCVYKKHLEISKAILDSFDLYMIALVPTVMLPRNIFKRLVSLFRREFVQKTLLATLNPITNGIFLTSGIKLNVISRVQEIIRVRNVPQRKTEYTNVHIICA